MEKGGVKRGRLVGGEEGEKKNKTKRMEKNYSAWTL